MVMTTKHITIGPILKQSAGTQYCFRACFNNIDDARKYMDELVWCIESDNKQVMRKKGYYG